MAAAPVIAEINDKQTWSFKFSTKHHPPPTYQLTMATKFMFGIKKFPNLWTVQVFGNEIPQRWRRCYEIYWLDQNIDE